MKKIFFLLLITLNISSESNLQKPKIIGLMQIRNEAPIIETALRGLAEYTDSIIVLDDNSSDNTLSIVRSLSKELNIEKIIKNPRSAWFYKSEIYNKQTLLKAGRSAAGTHFIQLDADEILTANCKTNNWMRNKILELPKGHVLRLRVIDTWKGIEFYRDDQHVSPRKLGFGIVIHDDGICNWNDNKKTHPNNFIHIGRFPECLNVIDVFDGEHYLIHFKYANFDFLKIKIAWYMCLERIRLNEKIYDNQKIKTIDDINHYYNFYQTCFKPENIVVKPLKKEWLGYKFFNPTIFEKQYIWRKKEIQSWLRKYGKKYFEKLNIWNIGINWYV